jgi:hypothetical protein
MNDAKTRCQDFSSHNSQPLSSQTKLLDAVAATEGVIANSVNKQLALSSVQIAKVGYPTLQLHC